MSDDPNERDSVQQRLARAIADRMKETYRSPGLDMGDILDVAIMPIVEELLGELRENEGVMNALRRQRDAAEEALLNHETEWGLRYPSGLLFEPYASREAAEDSVRPGAVVVCREVGPWIEVQP